MFECKLCGGQKFLPINSEVTDRFGNFDDGGKTFHYGHCERCQLFQIETIPQNLPLYYSGYQIHKNKSLLYRIARKLLVEPGYPQIERCNQPLKILDYGCGDGWYLESLMKKGHECIGFEYDGEHCQKLSKKMGIPVVNDLAKLENKIKFNKVVMNFSFEHIDNPVKVFSEVVPFLASGGELIISIPNIKSVDYQFFGRDWFDLDPPRHITFFEKKHIKELGTKGNLELTRVEYASFPNSIAGSLSYKILGKFHYLFWTLLILPAWMLKIYFNDGVILYRLKKS